MGCGGSKAEAEQKAPESKIVKDQRLDEEGTVNEEQAAVVGRTFQVTLEKDADSDVLGMRIDMKAKEKPYLVVMNVNEEGLVPRWNLKHEKNPLMQICRGDLIIDINGKTGIFDIMLDQLKTSKIFNLTLKREELEEVKQQDPVIPDQENEEESEDITVLFDSIIDYMEQDRFDAVVIAKGIQEGITHRCSKVVTSLGEEIFEEGWGDLTELQFPVRCIYGKVAEEQPELNPTAPWPAVRCEERPGMEERQEQETPEPPLPQFGSDEMCEVEEQPEELRATEQKEFCNCITLSAIF